MQLFEVTREDAPDSIRMTYTHACLSDAPEFVNELHGIMHREYRLHTSLDRQIFTSALGSRCVSFGMEESEIVRYVKDTR